MESANDGTDGKPKTLPSPGHRGRVDSNGSALLWNEVHIDAKGV